MNPNDKIDLEVLLEEAREHDFPLQDNFAEALFNDALDVQSDFKQNQIVNTPEVPWLESLFQLGHRLSPLGPGIVVASTVIGVILGYYVAEDLEVITLSAFGFYPDPTGLEFYGNIEELLQLDVG